MIAAQNYLSPIVPNVSKIGARDDKYYVVFDIDTDIEKFTIHSVVTEILRNETSFRAFDCFFQ